MNVATCPCERSAATCHCERSAAIRFRVCVATAVFLLAIVSSATAKYSGGSGTADDPYQIATAADLILLGETPADYDKHFILTADIDLDPNLPGRKVFDKAVIAPPASLDKWGNYQGTAFAGVLDGNGHTILHLTIKRGNYVGLFGKLASPAEVKGLGVVDINIVGSGRVGGLVGLNAGGTVTQCHSTGTVSGNGSYLGGLVGENVGTVTQCYSTGAASGVYFAGGLVGMNRSGVTQCWSWAKASGERYIGGLVGYDESGDVTQCYSSGAVTGESNVGGLVGNSLRGTPTACFWDTQTSGQTKSAGGTGQTTAQMRDIQTYLGAGWDFVGETGNGTSEIWQMPPGGGYPVLTTFNGYVPAQLKGHGTPEEPYLISDALDLGAVVHYSLSAHYRLAASIDLAGIRWGVAVIPRFAGTFDANGHTISHLTIHGGGYLGLFGRLASGAEVKNLGVVDIKITGSGTGLGGLAGLNSGHITRCYSNGVVSGGSAVGGVVGSNGGTVSDSYSTGKITGDSTFGGLVGNNYGSVIGCYSAGVVSGSSLSGGLVGNNGLGTVLHSVWDVQTSGLSGSAGGVGLTTSEMMAPNMLAVNGFADDPNWVLDAGHDYPRLAWEGKPGSVIPEFPIDWLKGGGTSADPYRVDTAGQLVMSGRASVLWDKHFVLGADINLDPKLPNGQVFPQAVIPAFMGIFDGNDHTISRLAVRGGSLLGLFGQLKSGGTVKSLGVVDVNIAGSSGYVGGLVGSNGGTVAECYSSGVVSGNSYVGGVVGWNEGTVTHSRSTGAMKGTTGVGGLVGYNYGSVVQCYSAGAVSGEDYVGGLTGLNGGTVARCYSTGVVKGDSFVGGLAGDNSTGGFLTVCHSTSTVSGTRSPVGGLVGENWGDVTQCYSTGNVRCNLVQTGDSVPIIEDAGGLIGMNYGNVTRSYCTGAVTGDRDVGGLVGRNSGDVTQCYSTGAVEGGKLGGIGGLVGGDPNAAGRVTACFWDIQTSGQTKSASGAGKTTAEMQTAKTFLDAAWDFVGETKDGTEDIWGMLEGKDYPRLAWEFWAFSPDPADGATDVIQAPTLSWLAAREAVAHDVYFDQDKTAVANATPASLSIYRGRQAVEAATYGLGCLGMRKDLLLAGR